MDATEWMIVVGICAVLSGVFSALVGAILGYVRDYRVSRLENAVEDMQTKAWSVAGNAKRNEKAERQQAMMMEFAMEAQKPDANIPEVIKKVAAKYQDIAMSLLQKGIKM